MDAIGGLSLCICFLLVLVLVLALAVGPTILAVIMLMKHKDPKVPPKQGGDSVSKEQ